MMKFILSTGYMLPRDRWWLRGAVGCTVNSFIRKATIATIPIWMRRIGGISQSRLTDAVVTLVMRRVMTAVHKRRELEIRLIRLLSPLTAPIMEPVLREQSPEEPVTLTPEQARERYQRSTPKEQYAQLLARRRDHRAPRPYSRDRDERLLDFA
jgi:hypothetical protein